MLVHSSALFPLSAITLLCADFYTLFFCLHFFTSSFRMAFFIELGLVISSLDSIALLDGDRTARVSLDSQISPWTDLFCYITFFFVSSS